MQKWLSIRRQKITTKMWVQSYFPSLPVKIKEGPHLEDNSPTYRVTVLIRTCHDTLRTKTTSLQRTSEDAS